MSKGNSSSPREIAQLQKSLKECKIDNHGKSKDAPKYADPDAEEEGNEADIEEGDEGDEGEEGDHYKPKMWEPPVEPVACEYRGPVDKKMIAGIIAAHLAVDSSDSEIEASEGEEEQHDLDKIDEGKGSQHSGSRSGSRSGSGSVEYEWEDEFPFEQNVFSLAHHYNFHKRIATNKTAVVYGAFQKSTKQAVAIKIVSIDSRGVEKMKNPNWQPKLVSLKSAVQGHPNLPRMIGWHPLPNTECFATAMELVANDNIVDYVFGKPEAIKIYMRDVLTAVQWVHLQGVLYRDVKSSNVLWNARIQKAVLIDFDVSTFYRGPRVHKAVVGSDGYMAPEIVLIGKLKKHIREILEKEEGVVKSLRRMRRKSSSSSLSSGLKNAEDHRHEHVHHGKSHDKQVQLALETERATLEKLKHQRRALQLQLDASGYGLEADVYSCGVLLGQLLFEEDEEDVLNYCDDNPDEFGDYLQGRVTHLKTKGAYTIGHSLLLRMLQPDPAKRITLEEALKHPFFTGNAEDHAAYLQREEQAALAALAKEKEKEKEKSKVVDGIECGYCKQVLPKEKFSKSQLKRKKGEKLKCFKCSTASSPFY